MVAITVILAAVIGTFVLGLGDSVESAPQASITFDYDSTGAGAVEIQHRGGDGIDTDEFDIRVAGDSIDDGAGVSSVNGTAASDLSGLDEFRAGDTITVTGSGNLEQGDQVDVVYTSGERDSIIGSFTVPEDSANV
jgi:FlaG/FlaF family flagellin (archaellin)